MVLAPESDYVAMVTTPEQKEAVDSYIDSIRHKTERERMIDKKVSGVFTGAYAANPLTGKRIPVWVSDYVLAGYGKRVSWLCLPTTAATMLSRVISICR